MKGARKRPPRLERPIKQYGLNQCALYGVKGFGQLLKVLRWNGSRKELEALPDAEGSYREHQNGEGRWIQVAGPGLRQVHTRIANLLRRVVPPDYRSSGVRGRSFLSNAQQHVSPDPSLKLDIRRFYPSTSFAHVRRFFEGDLHCAPDVAFLLAKLCCYRQKHVPTGCVHSEVLSFYCHKACFDKLLERAKARGGVMTVYVDDIMLTMTGASRGDIAWARRLFAGHGIKLHPGKTKVLRKNAPKVITGVLIHRGRIGAPQKQHLAVKKRFEALTSLTDLEARRKAARSLVGCMDHMAQIEPRFASKAHGNRTRLVDLIGRPRERSLSPQRKKPN